VLHIILPCIRGTLMVAGLFRVIDSIKAFPLIYLLTDGGPISVTEATNYYAFQQAFNFSLSRFFVGNYRGLGGGDTGVQLAGRAAHRVR
jgi:ABC-type sugar transport system permease subunit